MAKLSGQFQFQGKVGNLVGCRGPFGYYIRQLPAATAKAPTPAQLAVRQRMKIVVAFLAPLRSAIYQGFCGPGRLNKTAAFNRATSHALNHAVRGTYPDLAIAPEGVLLSRGPLAGLFNPACVLLDGRIRLTWANAGSVFTAHDDDVVSLLIYNPQAGTAQLTEGPREACTATLSVADEPPGSRLLAYAYACSRQGKRYSDSQFLGEFVVEGGDDDA